MNQSETNPLATALAALMTGHNANPNTSLRIPLVDSNGNLQPGPTLAELASVLGGLPKGLSPNVVFENSATGATITIPKSTHQALFICAINGPSNTPSIFILPRTNTDLIQVVYQGTFRKDNITLDSATGDIIVSRGNSHFWYWLLDMERI